MGTPLMHLSCFHLLVGNAIIGYFEALLLARLFKIDRKLLTARLIPANYVSMLAGMFLLGFLQSEYKPTLFEGPPLHNAFNMFLILWMLAFVGSVLIEWPFVFSAMKPHRIRWGKGFLASTAAQIASYAVIVPLYLLAGNGSIFLKFDVDPKIDFVSDSLRAEVFYFELESGNLVKQNIQGSNIEIVADNSMIPKHWGLTFSLDNEGQWQLTTPSRNGEPVFLDVMNSRTPCLPLDEHQEPNQRQSDGMWTNVAHPVNEELRSPWHVQLYGLDGIRVSHPEQVSPVVIANFAMFGSGSWMMSNVTSLPHDIIVFENDDQIIVANVRTRKIGVLGRGSFPRVAIIEAE